MSKELLLKAADRLDGLADDRLMDDQDADPIMRPLAAWLRAQANYGYATWPTQEEAVAVACVINEQARV